MVGPTAVLEDESTWSLKNSRSSWVISRARATSSTSVAAPRSGRSARATSARRFDSSISGHSVADITQAIVEPIRSAAASLWSSGCGA